MEKTANVKTEVVFVMELLAQIKTGRIRVPKFQRPFVWGTLKIRTLLDSIKRGFPIGSIFLWDTSARPRSLTMVGPTTVADGDLPGQSVGYLLDGHQRLSTLMGVLASSQSDLKENDKERLFHVYYNLEEENFEHVAPSRTSTHHFPLRSLMDTDEFLDACDELRQDEPEKSSGWIKTARELVRVFQNCAVGVTRVFHQDMAQAIEAFTRLNTEGLRMTPDQIFFALVYKEGQINIGEEMEGIIERVLLPARYDDMRKSALLRVLLAAMNIGIYSSAVDWQKLVKTGQKKLLALLKAFERSLAQAVELLAQLGASSQKVLPYALQLVLLSEFYRASPTPGSEAVSQLKRWFWVSSFSGAFMVGSGAKFNRAVEAARKLAIGEAQEDVLDLEQPALVLPDKFHQKTARVRAFFLFLKSLKPLDPVTLEPIPRVLDSGLRDARKLFTTSAQGESGKLANRVLLGADFKGDVLAAFRELRDRKPKDRNTVLESHAIPAAAWTALCADDAARFMQERRTHLQVVEITFMEDKGVSRPRQNAQPPEHVVEDSDT